MIGVLFLLHPQHGTGEAVQMATRIHNWLGIACIASGAVRGLMIRAPRRHRWARVAWPLLLLSAAVLLLFYREPPGAYERDSHSTVEQPPRTPTH